MTTFNYYIEATGPATGIVMQETFIDGEPQPASNYYGREFPTAVAEGLVSDRNIECLKCRDHVSQHSGDDWPEYNPTTHAEKVALLREPAA